MLVEELVVFGLKGMKTPFPPPRNVSPGLGSLRVNFIDCSFQCVFPAGLDVVRTESFWRSLDVVWFDKPARRLFDLIEKFFVRGVDLTPKKWT